ncbi:MAG: flagellar hook-associated protein FlgL [Gammaproteobacteria bacterium]|nr:flagellar hook-associated protein FlgL [Gammaproteobacteria bacterium]
MRISTSEFQRQAVQAMQDNQARLAKTQLQVATGRRILTPSDDPAGARRILELRQTIEQQRQYQRNGDAALDRLSLEESALEGVTTALQRVKELAVKAGGGALAAADRAAIATEVSEVLSEVLALANTRDAGGDYLFAGYRVDTAPFESSNAGGTTTFSYGGDDSGRRIQVGPSLRVLSADSGQSVFVDVPTQAGGIRDLLSTVQSLVDALQGAASGEAGFRSQLAASQGDLDLALEHVLTVRASVGARLNQIEAEQGTAAEFELYAKESLSALEDLDYAEATGRLQLQLTILQASQQAFASVQGLSLFHYL